MSNSEKRDIFFKACGAIAAIASTLGLICGGIFGLYTYYKKSEEANSLKIQEIRLAQYSQKKEVYYELVDAAAAIASSTNKDDAVRNATKYLSLYFGRAHILAISDEVRNAKQKFRRTLLKELRSGYIPSKDLEYAALELAEACRKELGIDVLFSEQ